MNPEEPTDESPLLAIRLPRISIDAHLLKLHNIFTSEKNILNRPSCLRTNLNHPAVSLTGTGRHRVLVWLSDHKHCRGSYPGSGTVSVISWISGAACFRPVQ